jgi:transposase-like protein
MCPLLKKAARREIVGVSDRTMRRWRRRYQQHGHWAALRSDFTSRLHLEDDKEYLIKAEIPEVD